MKLIHCCKLKSVATVVALTAVVLTFGCGESSKPPVVKAFGVITINGKPLNNVEIRFVPMGDGMDGNDMADAVSDENGNFVLRLPGQTESGVRVGLNKVLLFEGPMPEGSRGESGESQMMATNFLKSLKNRPISTMYSSLGETPLSFDVTADKEEYNIELKY